MSVSMIKRCLMAAAIAAFFSLPMMAVPAQAQSGVGGIGAISSSSAGASRGAIRSKRKYDRRAGRGGKRGFGDRRAGRFSSGKGWFAGQRWFGGKRSTGGRIGFAGNRTARPQLDPIRNDGGHRARSAGNSRAKAGYSQVAYVTEEYVREKGAAPVAPVGRLKFSGPSPVIRLPQAKRIRHWNKGGGASSSIRYWRPAR